MAKSVKIIVMSDSHGDRATMIKTVEKHLKDADMFLFLGDGEEEYCEVSAMYPHKSFGAVRGNCDFGSALPGNGCVTVNGKKILYTHGYMQSVKLGLENLIFWARGSGADIVLYGHTHTAYTGFDDGLYIMNPGSLCDARYDPAGYGVIEITGSGDILLNTVRVNR